MALVAAARRGDLSVVRKLLQAGEDTEQVEDGAWDGDDDGSTALMWASMNNHVEIVQVLLEAGANPEARDEDSMTALMLAGMEGHKEIVWNLLQAKAEVDAQDMDGRTALHHSSAYGHAEIGGLLLSAGADFELKDSAGYTPLMTAQLDAYSIVVGMLLKCGASSQLIGRGMTAAEQEDAASKYSDWIGSEVFGNLDPHNIEDIDNFLTTCTGSGGGGGGGGGGTAPEHDARSAEAEALKRLNEAMGLRDAVALERALAHAHATAEKSESGFMHHAYVQEAEDFLELVAYEDERQAQPDSVRIYVVPREVVVEFRLERRLRPFRELLKQEKLKHLVVERTAALRGSLLAADGSGGCRVLAVSYPWQGPGDPDSANDRLDAIAAHLEEHPDISHVWWDWPCLPQLERADGELTSFERMYAQDMREHGVWLIYLCTQVLCVILPESMSRFWPQMELYLATRAVTTSGFVASFGRLSVRAIKSLAASEKEQTAALCAKWTSATFADVVEFLANSPVSRVSDREKMLERLPDVESEYIHLVNKDKDYPSPTIVPFSVVSEEVEPPTGPLVAELEQEIAALKENAAALKEDVEKAQARLASEKELREASMKGKEQEFKKVLEKEKQVLEDELQATKAEVAAAKKRMEEVTAQHAAQISKVESQVGQLEATLRDESAKAKVLRNTVEDMRGQVRVYARCRPMAQYELEKGCSDVAKILDASSVEIDTDRGRPKQFEFNAVFAPSTSNDTVFAECESLVESVIDGYNVCIFAYGQTGSGKTFTMTGNEEHPGLTPRAIRGLFGRLGDMKNVEATIQSYHVELHNDNLVDLYQKMAKKGKGGKEAPNKLEIKLDAKKTVLVKGATIMRATGPDEMLGQFNNSNEKRQVGATLMNAGSSRSHSIFTILVEVRNLLSKRTTTSKLSLVDLAGSERLNKTGATGERMKEALSINKSLSALGDVISALSSGETFIPYRNNKLTQLMQDSLGGNAKTLMFVNFSPADYNRDESLAALTYAQRVRKIQNKTEVQADPEEVSELKAIIAGLKEKLAATKGSPAPAAAGP